MNSANATRYVMPYQWIASGPRRTATGSIWGYINGVDMAGIVRQRQCSSTRTHLLPGEGQEPFERGRRAHARPHQAGLARGHALRLRTRQGAIDDARALELAHAVGHPRHVLF